MKRCSRCKEEKPLTEFCKYKTAKDGHNYSCKDCMNAVQRLNAAKRRQARDIITGCKSLCKDHVDKRPKYHWKKNGHRLCRKCEVAFTSDHVYCPCCGKHLTFKSRTSIAYYRRKAKKS